MSATTIDGTDDIIGEVVTYRLLVSLKKLRLWKGLNQKDMSRLNHSILKLVDEHRYRSYTSRGRQNLGAN